MTCSHDGCDRQVYLDGLCKLHRDTHLYRTGQLDTEPVVPPLPEPAERFLDRTTVPMPAHPDIL